MQQNQRASCGSDLLLAGDQRDLVRALQLRPPGRRPRAPAGAAGSRSCPTSGRTSARPRDRSCRCWSGRGWPSASGVHRRLDRSARRQSASFSGRLAAANSARRAALVASPQPGAAGRFRNLTLTCFLHNPRHLPGGVRGGGIKRRARADRALYQVSEIGGGSASGSGGAGARRRRSTAPRPARPGLRPARPAICARRAGELDLVVDLGQRIGSGEWLRGLVTCAALCYAAWSLAPASSRCPAPRRRPSRRPVRGSRARSPSRRSAYGADTGRRMAPTDAVEPLAESPERPIIDLRATLGRGDGFARVLERAGVAGAEADRVADHDRRGHAGRRHPPRHGDGPDARPPPEPHRRPPARPARLPRPLRPARRARPRRRRARAHPDPDRGRRDAACASRAGSAPASTARRAPPACRRARSKPISARSTPRCSVPAGINSDDRFDIIIEHRRAATGETETGPLLYAGLDPRRAAATSS